MVFTNLDRLLALAARTLGASPLGLFCDTVVPKVAPVELANACNVAAVAMENYGKALALLAPTQYCSLLLMAV